MCVARYLGRLVPAAVLAVGRVLFLQMFVLLPLLGDLPDGFVVSWGRYIVVYMMLPYDIHTHTHTCDTSREGVTLRRRHLLHIYIVIHLNEHVFQPPFLPVPHYIIQTCVTHLARGRLHRNKFNHLTISLHRPTKYGEWIVGGPY